MTRRHVSAAERERDLISSVLKMLTTDKLVELDKRGRYLAVADGYPSRTLGDGTSRSENELTSVESAVWRRSEPQEYDGAGDAIREVFSAIHQMADLAAKVRKKIEASAHAHEKAVGRQSALSGPCRACGREVAGGEGDPMRAGYCSACYRAWRRLLAGGEGADRVAFEASRKVVEESA